MVEVVVPVLSPYGAKRTEVAFERVILGRCVLQVLTWSPKIDRGHF